MKMHTRVLLLIVMVLSWLAACTSPTATPTVGTDDAARLPNPASAYCEEQGGRLEMRSDENGIYGVCIFDDGSECEEWAYYRGECAPGGPDAATPSGGEQSLLDTEWTLASLRGSPPLEGTHITLRFEESSLSGFAGCNAYGGGADSGNYVATADGRLEIPMIAITAMDCPSPEGVMEQEQAYVDALTAAAAYRLIDERLELQSVDGETILAYVWQGGYDMDPSDLVGSAWQLVSMDGTNVAEGSSITLVFQDAHRLSGHAGCRDYVAVYEAEGGDLGVSYTAMLGSVCADAAPLEQEGAYTTMLGWTDHYRQSEGRLELLTARGEMLLFEPLPEESMAALEGPTWSLLAFVEPNPVEGMPAPLPSPTEPLSGTEISATFEDGAVGGSTGCNTYQAAYTRDGATLTLGAIAVTEMACMTPEGVMDQEGRYLELLQAVTVHSLYAGQLWLETGDGQGLVFRAQAVD